MAGTGNGSEEAGSDTEVGAFLTAQYRETRAEIRSLQGSHTRLLAIGVTLLVAGFLAGIRRVPYKLLLLAPLMAAVLVLYQLWVIRRIQGLSGMVAGLEEHPRLRSGGATVALTRLAEKGRDEEQEGIIPRDHLIGKAVGVSVASILIMLLVAGGAFAWDWTPESGWDRIEATLAFLYFSATLTASVIAIWTLSDILGWNGRSTWDEAYEAVCGGRRD